MVYVNHWTPAFDGEMSAGEAGGFGQRFLLCSDGLSDLVSEDYMAEVLARETWEAAADTHLGRALDMGGHDNISLILIEPRRLSILARYRKAAAR